MPFLFTFHEQNETHREAWIGSQVWKRNIFNKTTIPFVPLTLWPHLSSLPGNILHSLQLLSELAAHCPAMVPVWQPFTTLTYTLISVHIYLAPGICSHHLLGSGVIHYFHAKEQEHILVFLMPSLLLILGAALTCFTELKLPRNKQEAGDMCSFCPWTQVLISPTCFLM